MYKVVPFYCSVLPCGTIQSMKEHLSCKVFAVCTVLLILLHLERPKLSVRGQSIRFVIWDISEAEGFYLPDAIMWNCSSEYRCSLGKTSHHLSPACSEISPDQCNLSKVTVILAVHKRGTAWLLGPLHNRDLRPVNPGGRNKPAFPQFLTHVHHIYIFILSILFQTLQFGVHSRLCSSGSIPDSAVWGAGPAVSIIVVAVVALLGGGQGSTCPPVCWYGAGVQMRGLCLPQPAISSPTKEGVSRTRSPKGRMLLEVVSKSPFISHYQFW